MNLGLAVIGDISQEKTNFIVKISDEMKLYFKDKNYGSDIKSYSIGIICVNPQFEQFFKGEKPKYTKGKKTINPDGIPFTLEDNFEYSIKIDFNAFNSGTENECIILLAKEILESVSIVESMKTKIKDFDTVKFKSDLKEFFNLI